jgi:hypothetical protein
VSDVFGWGRVCKGRVQSMWSSMGDSWTSREEDRWAGESGQGVEPLLESSRWSEWIGECRMSWLGMVKDGAGPLFGLIVRFMSGRWLL